MIKHLLHWRIYLACLFLFCCGMIGFALYHQIYAWVMPCLLCVYQRLGVIVIGLLALIGAIRAPKSKVGTAVLGGLIVLASAVTAGVAAWNLLLQYGPREAGAQCASSLPFPIDLNQWPEWVGVLIRPVGDCSQITFTLFGLSVPLWMMLSALAIAVVTAVVTVRRCKALAR
ncbi:disulfide bond formation protein B [Silvimonas iriomotensis]|uniref:Disulfide bond formation protein B n=1 Tax=Silvimonas iriomotensis TaxID=449662 RepID=A0ABQ2P4R4_9NEIS|nr:disulfide bond formation protein B [Silvimonas iriomotensis]GGP18081.1 hypothetical protein GCM10010970_03040 [Silvimonas iriomotensis]